MTAPSKKRHGHGIDCSCVTRGEQCEEAFAWQVREWAELNGWLVHQMPTFRPTCSSPGFPDLVMAGHGRVIFAEIKRDKGRLSDAQWAWVERLIRGPSEVYTWRPQDWSAIEDRLRRPPAAKRLPREAVQRVWEEEP